MKRWPSLIVCALCIIGFSLQGQVVINEYSASNLEGFLDNYGRTEDWIELYNTSDQAVDLTGWHLSDKGSKPGKWEMPFGTVIGPNGYLVFWCSGRDIRCGNHFHTNFKLAQTEGKDIVLLSDASETVVNEFEMDITLVEHSRCRETDGSDNWMVGMLPTPGWTNDGSQQAPRYTVAPSMDVEAGFYQDAVTVTITNNEPNSVIHYTTNGDNPTVNSAVYTEPLVISSTSVVKAQAHSNDPEIITGKMDFNTYFINEDDFSLAVFSVAADRVIELANGNGPLIPIGSLEYFDLDKQREAVGYGSLNRHGQDSWALDHRSLDWFTRDEMGYTKEINAELFSYSDRDHYQKFMFRNSGDDNYPAIDDFAHEGSTHIRDEYVQTLALEGELELDTRAVERVIVYLNGEYWGVYGMRERPVDHDYTGEYYDQGKYDIHFLSTWGNSQAQYGGQEAFIDWVTIRDFILENDMSDPANYERVDDEINLTSFADYFIMNLFVVAKDWLNYNTGWWRGLDPDGKHKKWGYILWDLDATFGYYINYTGVPNEEPDATPCDIDEISDFMDDFFGNGWGGSDEPMSGEGCESISNGTSPYTAGDPIYNQVINVDQMCCSVWDSGCQAQYDAIIAGGGAECNLVVPMDVSGNVGKHEKILLKLQEESPEFRQLYFSRMADLRNTVFTCENMNTTLDRMFDVIRPEMPKQIERWGGTMQGWNDNVDDLYEFVNSRCNLIDDGMVSCYDLTGPFQLTLNADPIGIGEIDINTLDIETFPWQGEYFGEMDNKIVANVWDENEADWTFSHWETAAGSEILSDITDENAVIRLTSNDTLTAVFTMISSLDETLLNDLNFKAFPNPAHDQIVVEFNLNEATDIQLELLNVVGQKLMTFNEVSGKQPAGLNKQTLNIDRNQIPSGFYLLKVKADEREYSVKVSLVE